MDDRGGRRRIVGGGGADWGCGGAGDGDDQGQGCAAGRPVERDTGTGGHELGGANSWRTPVPWDGGAVKVLARAVIAGEIVAMSCFVFPPGGVRHCMDFHRRCSP